MKRTPTLVMVGLVLASAPYAQTNVSPSAPAPVADAAALVAHVTELEQQLEACHQQAETAPQPATNIAQPAPAYVPAPRYGGGFRMAAEPRLTCDDYSTSYFERHPTMAKVCGREGSAPQTEVSVTVVQDAVSATLVSGTHGL
jgi:hypothetical protein